MQDSRLHPVARIGVAGGGIAGLAAATFLARLGLEVQVFERDRDLRTEGTGILVQPAGVDVLSRLGLADEAFALGTPIDRVVARSARRRKVLLSYETWQPGTRALGIRRPALAALLLRHARAHGADVRFGESIENHVRDADGDWLISPGSGVRHGPFDLVLACDGVFSRLRAALFPQARLHKHERGVFSVVIPMPDGLAPHELLQSQNGLRDGAGLLPLGADSGGTALASFFWNAREDELPGLKAAGIDSWRRYITGFCPEVHDALGAFRSFDDLTFWNTADVNLSHWSRGNVLAMGDAAHALNPQLGMGATLALQDAESLPNCLGDSSGGLATALAMHEARRRASVRHYARVSRFWSWLDNHRLTAVRRSLFLAAAQGPSAVRRRLLRRVCGYL